MAHWHGLAKLRLHTDDTLDSLDKLTTVLGDQLRKFKKRTCSAFATKELPRETQARENQKAKKVKKSEAAPTPAPAPAATPHMQTEESDQTPAPRRLLKEFSLNTYKNHSLGDYVDMIRRYGTTDSYNTESVSSQP